MIGCNLGLLLEEGVLEGGRLDTRYYLSAGEMLWGQIKLLAQGVSSRCC